MGVRRSPRPPKKRKKKKRGREREGNGNCEVLAALVSPTAVAASHVPDGAEP